jgi:hypothetical protein
MTGQFFLWRKVPNRPQSRSLLRFIDYTELDTHAPGRLLWTSDQLVADAAIYTTHNIREENPCPQSGKLTHDPSNQGATDLHLRPHGHQDKLMACINMPVKP